VIVVIPYIRDLQQCLKAMLSIDTFMARRTYTGTFCMPKLESSFSQVADDDDDDEMQID